MSIVFDGWTNVKGKPLISVLAVSVSGAMFLSAYDYSEKFNTDINIAKPLLETIKHIGPYNVIRVIIDNFLSHGKYIVKLLERCGMVDYKSVTTSMELNFKKLCGNYVGFGLANPTEYHQLVGVLMFLVNSCPDICFPGGHVQSIYGRASSHLLDCCQKSLEISPGHNPLWTEIHCQEFEATWIYRC